MTALIFATAANAQTAATAQALADKAMAGSGAYAIVESLVTEVGPRPVGSPSMTRAKDWAVAKLTALGFKNVHAEPFEAWAWERGAESAQITAPYPQPLALIGLGDSVPTPKGGSRPRWWCSTPTAPCWPSRRAPSPARSSWSTSR